MSPSCSKPPLFFATPSPFLLFSILFLISCNLAQSITVPWVTPFKELYAPIWGTDGRHLVVQPDGKSVNLLIDATSGAGFNSTSPYKYGFYSSLIKLPSNKYTAGICATFYTSNQHRFPKNHDEIDFEFLGNVQGGPWTIQTNVYGNGNVNEGKEERYTLPFDPSIAFHRYSIMWNAKNIIFYIDDIPIREVWMTRQMEGDYPSKPMSLYSTIWEAPWATAGGKAKVDYSRGPYIAEYRDFLVQGCKVDPNTLAPNPYCAKEEGELNNADYSALTPKRRVSMRWFRQKYVLYSYCYHKKRFPTPPEECRSAGEERHLFNDDGNLKVPPGPPIKARKI